MKILRVIVVCLILVTVVAAVDESSTGIKYFDLDVNDTGLSFLATSSTYDKDDDSLWTPSFLGINTLHLPKEHDPNSDPKLLWDFAKPISAVQRWIVRTKKVYKCLSLVLQKILSNNCDGVIVHRDLRVIDGFSLAATRRSLVRCLLKNTRIVKATEMHLISGCVHGDVTVKGALQLIELDDIVSSSDITWNLNRVSQRTNDLNGKFNRGNATGAGVTAYVLDGGIYSKHTDFGGRVLEGYNGLSDNLGTEDQDGHGTHCAALLGGNIYGIAPGVKLVPVRVVDANGVGRASATVAAVDWILKDMKSRNGPSIASASLGSPLNQSMNDAFSSLSKAMPVFVAASNYAANCAGYSPASLGGNGSLVTVVGATGPNDARHPMSNYGKCVDIFAPGQDIISAWVGSPLAYKAQDGTSMATPQVAGAAALYLEKNPTATAAQVKEGIVCASSKGLVFNSGNRADASDTDPEIGISNNRLLNLDFSSCSSTVPPSCSGRGYKRETRPGTCQCAMGYSGNSCESSVCSGRGYTQTDDITGAVTCTCTNGYYGDNCEIVPCQFHKEFRDAKTGFCKTACSGNGFYPYPNHHVNDADKRCICHRRWTGANCEVPACGGHGTLSWGLDDDSFDLFTGYKSVMVDAYSFEFYGPPSLSCMCDAGYVADGKNSCVSSKDVTVLNE